MPIDKIIDPNVAANAYSNTAGARAKPGIKGDDGVKFSDFLRSKAGQAVQTLKAGEQTSARAVAGEAELTEVVQALTAAETTLQTVVSIRDRLISAYQEIMRMPI